jgi:hypothetical protein
VEYRAKLHGAHSTGLRPGRGYGRYMKRRMRHNIAAVRTFGKGTCRDCGESFTKYSPNQVHCEECSVWVNETHGRYYGRMGMNYAVLKAAADRSGNPRIWTNEECSQEELRSLIPRM